MIYDRTKEDVENAIKIREEKIKHFLPLSEEDIEIIERGFFTKKSVNRIEQKEYDLCALLREMGYYNIGLPSENKVEWVSTDIFYQEDLRRIFCMCSKFKQGFFSLSFFPEKMEIGGGFENINSLEKTLHDIEQTAESVKRKYKKCGKVVAGQK